MKTLASILALVLLAGCILATEEAPPPRCGPLDTLAFVDTTRTDTIYVYWKYYVSYRVPAPDTTP